jgi:BlaI family transcriptional regulator, penicillinase repressor
LSKANLAPTDSPVPTPREFKILKILWQREKATARDVYRETRKTARVLKNTVQSSLRAMERRGLVRSRPEDDTLVYTATIARRAVTGRLTRHFVQRVFDGSVEQLVATLIVSRSTSPEALANLEELLVKWQRRRKPNS